MIPLFVIKRNGYKVDFDKAKIALAIKKGFDSVYEEYDEKKVRDVLEAVLKKISQSDDDKIKIELIQDYIEDVLKSCDKEVYKSFSEYREKRKQARELFLDDKKSKNFLKNIENITFKDNKEASFILTNKYAYAIMDLISYSYLIKKKYLKYLEDASYFLDTSSNYLSSLMLNLGLDYERIISNTSIRETLDIKPLKGVKGLLDNLYYLITKIDKDLSGEIVVLSLDELIYKAYLEDLDSFYNKYLNILIMYEELDTFIDIKKIGKYKNHKKVGAIIKKAEALAKEEAMKKMLKDYKAFISLLKKTIPFDHITLSFKGSTLSNLLYKETRGLKVIMTKEASLAISKFHNDTYISYKGENYTSSGFYIYENYLDANKQGFKSRSMLANLNINLNRALLKEGDTFNNINDLLEVSLAFLADYYDYLCKKYASNAPFLMQGVYLDSERLKKEDMLRRSIKQGVLGISLIGLDNLYQKNKSLTKKVLDLVNTYVDNYKKEGLTILLNASSVKTNFKEMDLMIYGERKGITDKPYTALADISLMNKYFKGGYVIASTIKEAELNNYNFIKLINVVE